MKAVYGFKQLALFLCFASYFYDSYCQTASFIAPDTICVNTTVAIRNTSAGGTNFLWNFNVASVNQNINGNNLGNVGGQFSLPVFTDIVFDNGNYYVFVVNNHPGSLVRLDFGNSLLNAPAATNLGNFNGVLPDNAEGIQVIKNENKWYAIIVGGDPTARVLSRIIRVSFGNSIINNSPVAFDWGNIGNLSYPVDLHVFNEQGRWYGFTLNAQNNTITRFSFSQSFENVPTGVNLGSGGNLDYPTGIYAVKSNSNWFVFITNGTDNASITRLDFGSSLLNTPVAVNIGNPGMLLHRPRDIYIVDFCGSLTGLVVNGDSKYNDIIKLDFGTDIKSRPVAASYGNIGNLSFPHSISKIFRVNTDLYTFITNVINNTITRINFSSYSGSNIVTSSDRDPAAVLFDKPGVFNINLDMDLGLPTQSSFCKQIVVVSPAALSLSNDTTICAGNTIQLNVSGGSKYLWAPDVGITNNAISNPYVFPASTTKYFVEAVNNAGCVSRDSVTVTVTAKPPVTLDPLSANVCAGDSVKLVATGGDSYSWLPAVASNSSLIVRPQVNTVYTVVIRNASCKVSDTLTSVITVNKGPGIAITKSGDIDCSVTRAMLTATGGSSYIWSPAAGLSNTHIANPEAAPTKTTVYYVTAKGINGCTSNDSIDVKVTGGELNGKNYLLPSAFTPNGDGSNDCFGVRKWYGIKSIDFSIYNRWGERVFHTKDPSICWDGTYRQVVQSSQTFVYLISATTNCGYINKKGTVILLK